jgi:hypothetical protein
MMFFFNIDVEIIYEIFIYSSILNIKKWIYNWFTWISYDSNLISNFLSSLKFLNSWKLKFCVIPFVKKKWYEIIIVLMF